MDYNVEGFYKRPQDSAAKQASFAKKRLAPKRFIDTEPNSSGLSTNQILLIILAIGIVYYFCNQKKSTFRIRRHY